MIKKFVKLSWVLAVLTLGIVISCKEELINSTEEVENYTGSVVEDLQEKANCGKLGCYELMFPVTIQFPDSSKADVTTYEELRNAIKTWKTNNPEATAFPTFVYPISVVDKEGNITVVSSQEELRALRGTCVGRHGDRGRRGHGKHCFTLVFPVQVSFPDGTVVEATGPAVLRTLLHAWRKNNPNATEKPELVFPITVKMEDGTEVIAESKEALKALKETCTAETAN